MDFSVMRAIVILISLPLFAQACGNKEATSPDASAPAQAAAPPADPPAEPAAQAPAEPTAAGSAALASAEGEVPDLTVEIQELKRTAGDTLTLKLAFANSGQQEIKMDKFGGSGMDTWTISGINLVDIVGKKKYFVATDSEGVCLCSRDISALQPKARVNLWAKFPAPPPDVQVVSVLIPRFAPIDEIPIS